MVDRPCFFLFLFLQSLSGKDIVLLNTDIKLLIEHKEEQDMILKMILALIAGFIALIKGADLFVEGSSAVARKLHVSSIVIGLTVVALGTSAPELAVSASSALQGANEIALSNIVGSNIFNLLCVLGLCAIMHPVPFERVVVVRDFTLSIIMTLFVLVSICGWYVFGNALKDLDMSTNVGLLGRYTSFVLILIFISYLVFLIKTAPKEAEETRVVKERSILGCLFLILFGLTLIIGGGEAVVYGARTIAKAAGMTETLIGLTIVAIGTSLPELVTSVVAAAKKQTDLAVGNAIGSNIFNLLFILGVSSMIHPISVNIASVIDLAVLLLISILTALFAITGKRINRFEGMIMVFIYAAYTIFAIIR